MSSPSKDWADEDGADDVSPEELKKRLGIKDDAPNPSDTEEPAVASLLSRISGLSTNPPDTLLSFSSEPPAPASPAKPAPKPTNALFGRALAGVKADRTPIPSSPSPAVPAPATSSYPVPSAVSSAAPSAVPSAPTPPEPAAILAAEPSTKPEAKTSDYTGGNALADGLQGENNGWQQDSNSVAMDDGASGLVSNDFQVEVKLADQQADPNSPLYSAKTFEELPIHEALLKGIYAVGFSKPSKIQEKALPLALANPPRNLIGQSQSGTGKTAAFTLNVLSRAIVLAPSRELARQIKEVMDKIGQFTEIKTRLAVPQSWKRNERIHEHVLIGTPGTLVDMLSRGDRVLDAKQIRVFVLDEADEMIALQGLGDQTMRIKRALPPHVQYLLFSATFPDDVQAFASQIAPEANSIYLKKEEVTVEKITQLYLECSDEEGKFDALLAMYDCLSIGQSIVFCRKKATADEVARRLIEDGHSVISLHGEKTPEERDRILDDFRDGKKKVLITTNVLSRGIDIQQVNMVVNYDVPDMGPESGFAPDVETYIHRIGRTGRFGRRGCSVSFVHDGRSKRDLEAIMDATGKRMKKIDATNQSDLEQLDKALKEALKDTKA
ncbi:RNA helicase required for poly(A+) mRNA export [Cryptotrichosporon argae]